MAATDKHLVLNSHPGDKIDDEGLQVTSESLGQLVCISGVQTGILRYFGQTHFETGVWCGVECDHAVGKNDGSVMGVRYFSCKEKFGIFAPLSKVTLVHSPCEPSLMKQNSGTTPNESSTHVALQPEESNRPKTLPTSRTNVKPQQPESAPVAPATTPVAEDNYLASLSTKRLKKESKRGKDGHRLNQQLKKKRKLDSSQKAWSASNTPKCPTSIMSHNVDLPNLLSVKLKDEILGASFANSPMYSPPPTFKEGFTARLISSTPAAPGDRAPVSRLERLRYERSNYPSTPKSSRILDAELDSVSTPVESDASQHSSATPSDLPQDTILPDAFVMTQPILPSVSAEVDASQDEGALSPGSSTKEDIGADVLNLQSFPAKRPSSISLFPGFSSEDSSEQGIFGVSTPELIGGDSASLALSIPTSCCSSPEVLDNESSLGLLTPSHLQDCWNSNTNDEDLYQHLRSPSVDDLEEFEEEDKTVDQDLPDQVGQAPDNFRMMSNSYSGSLHVNKNDGLGSSHHHHHHHPMHHSLHEELSNSSKVKRDKTYTQLPTVPNLNQQSSELPLHQQQSHQHQQHQHHHHAPLSFRGSGSGSGSGYCASDPFTDSDFNTESEADHDDCNGSTGMHINPTSLKHRSARVIDGALYTSHHGGSSSLHQHLLHRQEASDGVGKSIDMISSSISVSVSSTSASACASEMESSGFYSDASERNPSGGSIMSESDGYRSSRHLSKSSSDCDDSVALNMGLKIMPLRPLTQSDDSMGYSTERDFGEIISGSSLCEGLSSFEAPSLLSETLTETLRQESEELEENLSHDKVAIVKTHPPTVEYQNERVKNTNAASNGDQIVPTMLTLLREKEDVCEAMEVDGYPEYGDNQQGENMMAHSTGKKEMGTLNNNGGEFAMKYNEQPNPPSFSSNGSNSPNKDMMMIPSSSVSYSAQTRQDMNNGIPVIDPLATVPGTGESSKGMEGTQTSPNKLGASQDTVVDMDLEDVPNSAHETSAAIFRSESLSVGSSPATSPLMNTTVVALNATALHGNIFENGVVGSGGGGLSCMRSQSVNCIASLTSSTSSASTVTAKSCVTSGGQHATRNKKATSFTKSGLSSKSRIPSSDSIPVLCGSTAKAKEAKSKIKITSSRNGMVNSAKDNGPTKSNRNRQGGTVTASSNHNSSSSVASNITNSTTNVSSTTHAAEQSSAGSAATTGSGSSSRRSSRVLAGNGKATSGSGGGSTSARNKCVAGVSGAKGNNISTSSSITSTISDLNKSSRSKASVHGSTRSLASVGLAPSGSSTVSKSAVSPACKKINKWDAVMSKIAETKHKTINVKDIKSKVFNSVKSAGSVPGSGTSTTNGKMVKGVKSASRVTLNEGSHENDPLVPPAIHLRQHHFSSRSSTVSDSSMDDQPHRGPPPVKHRVKKDVSISRRQISDLSSASDYSANQSQHSQQTCNSSHSTTMTTGSTRRPQRNNNSSATGTNGTKNSTASNATNTSTKSHITKGAQVAEGTKRKAGLTSTQPAPGRGVTAKSKVGTSTVSSQNDPSTKSHPALKPLRDRNRLGPVGKNYASSGLDANANESEAPLLRGHGQPNGELESSGKSCTKVPGSAEPHIDPTNNTTSNTSNLIISKSKSSNNRVSSNNQQNIQNSVLLQENTSLKEEVSRLTSVVSDLQEQISRLAASGEDTRKALEGCLANADTRSVALSIVAQHSDKEKLEVYEQLLQQQAENNVWKQRLDEKLAELQKLQTEYEKEREESQEEIKSLIAAHEVEVDVTVRNCENKLEQMQKRHDETLAELKRSHTDELERLHESHRQELDQTIQKHKELLDEHRKQSPHDILHKEVESLQVVVEMRNEEIRVLRKDLMDYKNTLNDLQMAREHGKTLLAKIEDLEAQLEKARADKRSLQERYQMLESNLQQTESDNSRLARCNEELHWKIKSHNLEEEEN
ncbi:unnamed protein product [Orchesella dallaii]